MVRFALGPRAQAVLVLAFVAMGGAMLGILGDRVVAAGRADAARPGLERNGPRSMAPALRFGEGLATRLDLSARQRAQIDSILALERTRARELTRQYQPQFRALVEETRSQIEAVLSAEQREQLEEMRRQRSRRRDAPAGDRRRNPILRDTVPRP